MKLPALCTLLLALTPGCQHPETEIDPQLAKQPVEEPRSQLTFRVEVDPSDPAAERFVYEDQEVYLGEARSYAVRVFASQDDLGLPAIGFELEQAYFQEFGDFTEANQKKRMAILLGERIVTFPQINGRLQGSGVIEGGPGGFTAEEVQALVASMK